MSIFSPIAYKQDTPTALHAHGGAGRVHAEPALGIGVGSSKQDVGVLRCPCIVSRRSNNDRAVGGGGRQRGYGYIFVQQ